MLRRTRIYVYVHPQSETGKHDLCCLCLLYLQELKPVLAHFVRSAHLSFDVEAAASAALWAAAAGAAAAASVATVANATISAAAQVSFGLHGQTAEPKGRVLLELANKMEPGEVPVLRQPLLLLQALFSQHSLLLLQLWPLLQPCVWTLPYIRQGIPSRPFSDALASVATGSVHYPESAALMLYGARQLLQQPELILPGVYKHLKAALAMSATPGRSRALAVLLRTLFR